MTTDQLRRARIALGELHDIVNHLDEEHPLYVDRAMGRIEDWLERGRATANARREREEELSHANW